MHSFMQWQHMDGGGRGGCEEKWWWYHDMKPSGLTYGLALCGGVGAWQDSLFYYFLGVSTYFVLSIECMEQKYSKWIPRSYPFVEIGSTHLPLSRLLV